MPDGIKQVKNPGLASFHLAVTDEDGRPVLGNVFIVVCHEQSGQKWRGLRYSIKSKAYYYRDLPPGRFSISVSAAGYDSARRDLTLRGGESPRVEVELAPTPQGSPLILDTGEEMGRYQQFVRGLYHERELVGRFCGAPVETLHEYLSYASGDASGSPPVLSPQATILASLISDGRVVDALTEPTRMFSPDALSEWVEARLLNAWEFRAPEFMLGGVLGPVVESRVRLMALVRAVMDNAYVKTLAPELDDAAVTAHMLRFLASLDTPQLDEVIPIIIRMVNPSLAPVERFARGLLGTFDARVPAGAATPKGEGAAQPQDEARGNFGDGIERICHLLLQETGGRRAGARPAWEEADVRERASTVMFLLADVAGCLAAALDPAPLCIASLRREGVYA